MFKENSKQIDRKVDGLTETNSPTESRKLDFIDSLRGIASIGVVIFHTVFVPQPELEAPKVLSEVISTGSSGVILFFVISAFTLYFSMDHRDEGKSKVKNFYIRRVFRILPLFYCLLSVQLMLAAMSLRPFPSIKIILLNIVIAFNFVPSQAEGIVWASWTIGVEMLFYLLFPLVFRVVNSLERAVIFTILAFFCSSVFNTFIEQVLSLNHVIMGKYLAINFVFNLPIFAIGIICYFVYRDYLPKLKTLSPTKTSIYFIFLSLLLLVFLPYRQPGFLFLNRYGYAVAFCFLLLSLALSKNKLLVNKYSCFCGRISYSIYLIHPLAIFALTPTYKYIYEKILPFPAFQVSLCILVTLLLTVPVSFVTFHLIEKPGTELEKDLIARL